MITWLASYPKSGNTWLRALLTSYFYSPNGEYNFKILKNIYQFPSKVFFKDYPKNFFKLADTSNFWFDAQNKINKENKFRLFKTHNALLKINNNEFTNKKNTNGCIYIIRDPRNVITSVKNHYEQSYSEALDWMLDDKGHLYTKEGDQFIDFNFLGSWKNHYKSWISTKEFPILPVRYEDFENKPLEVLKDVINFIIKVGALNNSFDESKAKISIESCKFENLKKIEENEGFKEAPIGQKTKKKKIFFNLGKKNNWKKLLPENIKKEMNEVFKEDLIRWGYKIDD